MLRRAVSPMLCQSASTASSSSSSSSALAFSSIFQPLPELLAQGYAVQVPCAIQWSDIDVHNHVSNSRFFVLFETARVVYLERIGVQVSRHSGTVGPIVASIGATFRAPLFFRGNKGFDVVVCAKVSKLGPSGFTLTSGVYDLSARNTEHHGKFCCFGDASVVSYDYKELKRAPLPAEWAKAIEALDGIKQEGK